MKKYEVVLGAGVVPKDPKKLSLKCWLESPLRKGQHVTAQLLEGVEKFTNTKHFKVVDVVEARSDECEERYMLIKSAPMAESSFGRADNPQSDWP